MSTLPTATPISSTSSSSSTTSNNSEIKTEIEAKLIIECVFHDGLVQCFTKEAVTAALTKLSTKFENTESLLALDYHGVTDLFTPDINISSRPILVISFVSNGRRESTAADILKRINANQVAAGILVFKRAKKIQHLEGTKASVLLQLHDLLPKMRIDFVDDSSDHVDLLNLCTMGKNILNVEGHLVTPTTKAVQNLISYITDLESEDSDSAVGFEF
jgi:hypothetical protein